MNNEIFFSAFTLSASLFAAVVAYYQSKRIEFFRAYFQRKADSYEKLITSMCQLTGNVDRFMSIAAEIQNAKLYSTEKTLKQIEKCFQISLDFAKTKTADAKPKDFSVKSAAIKTQFLDSRDVLITMLREEINNCRRFRFSDTLWTKIKDRKTSKEKPLSTSIKDPPA